MHLYESDFSAIDALRKERMALAEWLGVPCLAVDHHVVPSTIECHIQEGKEVLTKWLEKSYRRLLADGSYAVILAAKSLLEYRFPSYRGCDGIYSDSLILQRMREGEIDFLRITVEVGLGEKILSDWFETNSASELLGDRKKAVAELASRLHYDEKGSNLLEHIGNGLASVAFVAARLKEGKKPEDIITEVNRKIWSRLINGPYLAELIRPPAKPKED